MKTILSLTLCASVGLLTMSLAGCSKGSSGPKTVSVSGTVTQGGKPMPGVEITFATTNFSSHGKTDTKGKYTLMLGAEPGTNKVSLSKWEGGAMIKEDPESGMDSGQVESEADIIASTRGPGAAKRMPRQLVPKEFQGIDYDVPAEGIDSADFRLP